MRGILITTRMNEVIFADIDDELITRINHQAIDHGLISLDDISEDEATKMLHTLDTSIIMQLFAPIVLSQWALIEQLKNPCSYIKCLNGYTFAFKQQDELLFMAICGDKDFETEDYLQRKLSILIHVLGFVFGLVPEEIGTSRFSEKKEKWELLKSLMEIWTKLFDTEHAYLVEAIEKLNLNQVINERTIDSLEDIVRKFVIGADRQPSHAMITVDSKVLAVYSNNKTQDLQGADILLINLLAHHFFPMENKLEDLFSQSYRQSETISLNNQRRSSRIEYYKPKKEKPTMEVSDSEDQYHSARTTPSNNDDSAARSTTPDQKSQCSSADSCGFPSISQHNEGFFTPQPDFPIHDMIREIESESHLESANSESTILSAETSASGDTNKPKGVRRSMEADGTLSCYEKQTVFLRTFSCSFAPHDLFLVDLFPGTVLTVIVEKPFCELAPHLCQIMLLLQDLLGGKKEKITKQQVQYIYDAFNNLMSKVLSPLKRTKGKIERIALEIKKFWDKEGTRNALLSYLREDPEFVSSSLENILNNLNTRLKNLFLNLYLSPHATPPNVSSSLERIQKKVCKKLSDFKEYLMVKAQRNITMTSYIEDFPGLIHFMFVDRQTNQMIAPSFNISADFNHKHDATELIKNKTWLMYQQMQARLTEGYTTVMLRDGDYHYSYFVWFEDTTGNMKMIPKSYKWNRDMVTPGIISGNFYRQIIRLCFPNESPSSIHCYEFFCMHVGLAPMQYIASQCRQLTLKLWESSGEAYTPISLL